MSKALWGFFPPEPVEYSGGYDLIIVLLFLSYQKSESLICC